MRGPPSSPPFCGAMASGFAVRLRVVTDTRVGQSTSEDFSCPPRLCHSPPPHRNDPRGAARHAAVPRQGTRGTALPRKGTQAARQVAEFPSSTQNKDTPPHPPKDPRKGTPPPVRSPAAAPARLPATRPAPSRAPAPRSVLVPWFGKGDVFGSSCGRRAGSRQPGEKPNGGPQRRRPKAPALRPAQGKEPRHPRWQRKVCVRAPATVCVTVPPKAPEAVKWGEQTFRIFCGWK